MDASVVVIIHTTSCIVQRNGRILAKSANDNDKNNVGVLLAFQPDYQLVTGMRSSWTHIPTHRFGEQYHKEMNI